MPQNDQEMPVYLFLGFLESGKTKFIQETLEDKRFNSGERTLVLVCEEGIEEYDTSKFDKSKVEMRVIEDEADFNPENLTKLKEETGGVKSRCIPFQEEHLADTCVCCGRPAKHMVYWGKQY